MILKLSFFLVVIIIIIIAVIKAAVNILPVLSSFKGSVSQTVPWNTH